MDDIDRSGPERSFARIGKWVCAASLLLAYALLSVQTARSEVAASPWLGLPARPEQRAMQSAPARARLGRKLFFDQRLSADGRISCSSCHRPELAFSDGRTRSLGHDGRAGTRNAPSLLNVAYLDTLFWDGRATDLQVQARAPLTNPVEHAFADDTAAARVVRESADYAQEFRSAYAVAPDGITPGLITDAIAAYERTLRSARSAFDRYQYGSEQSALSAAAVRGLALFRGRAQCASCHSLGNTSALFTDGQFHMAPAGLPASANTRLSTLAQQVLTARANGGAALEQAIALESDIAALGRFIATADPADIGKFKTPSLRNVALTAPYMHDGSVATLREAIDLELYGRGSAIRYPIVLTLAERADLAEFLNALTGEPHDF
jgi:cytochrome c peroxidase